MVFAEELKTKFLNLINTRSGLIFKDYNLRDVEQAIAQRMEFLKLESPLSYYALLTASGAREDEFRELLNLLTVNHTFFFRNEAQFKALGEKILPDLIKSKLSSNLKPTLRIWSAGCSTGEEPYSIAMILKETIPDLENWEIKIFATDVSNQALEKANRGVYSENSMHLVSNELREKYFLKKQISPRVFTFTINDEIKRMVCFNFFNLITDEYFQELDLVFCRNVVIYFEIDTIASVMNKFGASLNKNGYLFIGYSESLQFITDKFRMLDWQEAIYYCRSDSDLVPGDRLPVEQKFNFEEFRDEPLPAESDTGIKEPAEQFVAEDIQEMLARINKSIYLKRYDYALDLIAGAHKIDIQAVDPYCLAAEVLANQGKLKEAKEQIEGALKLNSFFAPAHYLYGSFCLEQEQFSEAQQSLKKAIYLDDQFVLAHFALANLYKNQDKPSEAIREYRNTLNLLAKLALTDMIAYSGGFNAAVISGACKDNLERLKVRL